jgi:hypothetical protein
MRETRRFQSVAGPVALLGIFILCPVAVGLGAGGGEKSPAAKRAGKADMNRKVAARRPSAAQIVKKTNIGRDVLREDQPATNEVVALLKEHLGRQERLLAAQQEEIEQLRAALEEQKQRLDRASQISQGALPAEINAGHSALLSSNFADGVLVNAKASAAVVAPDPGYSRISGVTHNPVASYTAKLGAPSTPVEDAVKIVGGFKLSGDFRIRADGDYRSGNKNAGPMQNSRGRYRMRINVDKSLSDQFDFHLGLGSGRSDNGLTSDSDFTGFDTRAPLYITEASADYHPNSSLAIRGGKLVEVFADDSRFLIKEEIRFNGFQEIARHSFESHPLGITSIELRGGQYVLTNPNVPVLPSAKACSTPGAAPPPACVYLNAGYAPGSNLRDADLFHQGFVMTGGLNTGWHYRFGADLQLWRNQNQIALAATAAGYGVVLNSSPGLILAGPVTGIGTATTTPGGAAFTAGHFQIAHINYQVGFRDWKISNHEMPFTLDLHASRNMGTGFLRDAVMGIASLGETRKPGDILFLYAYAIKDGNSMISEVTDDYVGSLSGVNIKTHEIRFDLGLTKFLTWQNYLYIINPRRPSDPARHFYVPVPAGANTQYRLQSQLQFKF